MTAGRNAGCTDDHCTTCGDIAEHMIVLQVDEQRALALCEGEAGEHVTVEILLVGPVAPGDQVLVHAGTAISSGDAVGRGGERSETR
jgi:hypothetical protein